MAGFYTYLTGGPTTVRSRQQWRARIFVCSVMQLTGCYPSISHIYMPTGSGRVLGSGPCSVNDSARIVIDLGDGAKFVAQVSLPSEGESTARISGGINLLSGQVARFETAVVKIKINNMTSAVDVPISRLKVSYVGTIPDGIVPGEHFLGTLELMDPGPRNSAKPEGQASFGFSEELPFTGTPNFTATFPAIIIGGRTMQIDPVKFAVLTRARTVGVACF